MILKSSTLKNSFLLGLDRISAMATSFIVGVVIARSLGADEFGVYSFSLSILNIFLSIGNAGLSSLLIRDLVLKPEEESTILGSAIGLKFLVSFLSGLGIVIFSLMSGVENKEYLILLILSLTIPLNVISLLEYWFQSKRKIFEYIVYKTILIFTFLLLKVWVILQFESLIYFSYLHVLYFVTLALTIAIIFKVRSNLSFKQLKIDKEWCSEYLRNGSLLFLSTIVTLLYLKSDVIMVKYLSNLTDVGNYSAATQISELWYIFPTLIMTAYFPSFAKKFKVNSADALEKLQVILQIFLIIAIIISILISLTGKFVITEIFGTEFKAAISVLVVQVWSSIFVFQRIVISKLLVLENLFKFSLISQLVGLCVNIVLNFIMFSHFGIVGIAVATLIAYFFSNYLIFIIMPQTRYIFKLMNKSFISIFRVDGYRNLLNFLRAN